jgi:hypothetical protein
MNSGDTLRQVLIAISVPAGYNEALRRGALLAMCGCAEWCSLTKFSEAK